MSDLFTFYTTLTGVVGAKPLSTERATNSPTQIEIDKGMVAKIWEIQMEGPIPGLGPAKITIDYCLDITAVVPDWDHAKGFSRSEGSRRPERWNLNRPIIIEAWNDATAFRVNELAGSTAGTEIILIVEFAEMEKQ